MDTDRQFEAMSQRLAAERERTQSRIALLRRNFEDIVESSALVSTDDEHDPEGATIAFERQQVAALLNEDLAYVMEIDDAQLRLSEGRYGICAVCGGPIGTERLEARPAAARCVRCAALD
jgi:RNA polymerase-binding transcription factor DksA